MGTGGKIEAVLTCTGDIDDPDFPDKCKIIFDKLSRVLDNQDLNVTKCEPWNSVKVTFNIPKDAAEKLAKLAEAGDQVLRELGILSIQVEGGQVISMTMVEDDSESDADTVSAPSSSPLKEPISKNIVPKEETITVKQEPILSVPDIPSLKGSSLGNRSSLPFQSMLTGSSRDSGLASTAAMLMKNLPPSSGTTPPIKSSELSVLSSYGAGSQQLTTEGLLANLVSSRTSGKSELYNVSDEPVPKKPRKQETIKTSDNSLGSSSGYPFNKTGGSGFTILPVSTLSSSTSRTLPSGSQLSSLDSRSPNPVSGSSVKLANLPGVSLTSVNRALLQHSKSLSSRHGGLMPPPSSVTLSPVPRTNNVNNLSERTTERFSEPGDTKASPGGSSHSSPSKISLNNAKQTLLINPVTGNFEIGPTESAPEPDSESSRPATSVAGDSDSGGSDSKSKHQIEPPHSSPGGSSTSGEPSLKLKLKVSLPNNSSKGLKDGGVQSKNQTKVADAEPKLPKLKIKLKEKSVELENDEKSDSNALHPSEPEESSEGSLQLDLKTRVRIKPLPEKMRILEDSKPDSHFSNLNQINHISVDTNPDKKKKGNVKEKKGGKDRLAVWTESLAKHTKREDSGTKETKSWPELLENRLFSQGSNSIPPHSNLNFNKADVLKNQTEKGEDKTSEEAQDNHLNWAGPGREGAEPGPGHTLPLSLHPGNNPKPPDLTAEKESELVSKSEDGASKETGITSVLDILEGRRPLGDPISPLSTQGGHPGDHTGQQGEDSGIESMDTLSEKSPNQGESPFHGGNDPCIDGSRVPTYSSSMGPVSGKVSPPVSDSGSTDSLVTATPPDKSPTTGATPGVQPAAPSNHQEPVDTKPLGGRSGTDLSNAPSDTHSKKADNQKPTKPIDPTNSSSEPSVNCDSKPLQIASDISKVAKEKSPLERPNSPQSNALANPSSGNSLRSTAINISNSQSDFSTENIPEENGSSPRESESDLIRSYDGADDKCPGDFLDNPCSEEKSSAGILNSLLDYTNTKTVDYISDSSSNNCKSDCNIITLKNGEKSPPSSPVVIKAGLQRPSQEKVSDSPTEPLSVSRASESTTQAVSLTVPVSSVSVSTFASGLTVGPTVSGSGMQVTSTFPGSGLQVGTTLPLRPGAKMVPVKLVSVPGTGVRMVRVSPVKGGEIVGTTVSPSGLPHRAVVIKSSLLKPITTADLATADGNRTTCLVRIPGPGLSTSVVRYPAPTLASSNICDNPPSSREPSQTSVSLPSISSPAEEHHGPAQVPQNNFQISPAPTKPPPLIGTSVGASKSRQNSYESRGTGEDAAGSSAARNTVTSIEPEPSSSSAVSGDQSVKSATDPLTNGLPTEFSEVKPDKRKPRNGKKCSGEPNGDGDGGGSLLRPLIGKDDGDCEAGSVPPESSPVASVGKRTRRDTGSSVQSDKSDLSVISSQSVEPAAKRIKEEEKGRRGSKDEDRGGGRRRSTSPRIQEKKEDEKSSEEKLDTGPGKKKTTPKTPGENSKKGVVTNGAKSAKPKQDAKKLGRTAVSKDSKPVMNEKVSGSKDKPVSSTEKPGAALIKPDATRRVSTRVKKPDDTAAGNDKKKKR